MNIAWGPAFDAELDYRRQRVRADFRPRTAHLARPVTVQPAASALPPQPVPTRRANGPTQPVPAPVAAGDDRPSRHPAPAS